MLKKTETTKDLFIVALLSTALFYIAAHGHRFTNAMFSGDSLYNVYQNDSAWQIALGRFMQPILTFLRGGIESPFLICVLAVAFMVLSVFLMVDFLQLRRVVSIVAVAAMMTCNITVLTTNATFLSWSDYYSIALFLAVLSVWFMKKDKLLFYALGAISLSLSMGIYQAYLCVAIAMVMMYFLFQMLEKPTLKDTCIRLVKYLLTFLAAAVIYYVIWKVFQKVFNIWTAENYNGLSSVGDYSDTTIGAVLATTYQKVFQFFYEPYVFITMPFRGESLSIVWVYILRFCNLLAVLLLLLALVIKNLRSKTNLWHRLMQVAILLCFPFGINFVCFISKGMEHTLMIYAFCMVYVLAIKVTEGCQSEEVVAWSFKKVSKSWIVALAVLAIITWSNIVYSNQVYLKKDLQDKATLSLMTRIVYEIESMEGYVAGETPVSFYGSFAADTSCITVLEAFKDLNPYGMGKSPLLYVGTDYAYLTYILNVNMNLVRINDTDGTIKQMPVYPAEGSVAYVDGTVVVKVSELD